AALLKGTPVPSQNPLGKQPYGKMTTPPGPARAPTPPASAPPNPPHTAFSARRGAASPVPSNAASAQTAAARPAAHLRAVTPLPRGEGAVPELASGEFVLDEQGLTESVNVPDLEHGATVSRKPSAQQLARSRPDRGAMDIRPEPRTRKSDPAFPKTMRSPP